MAQFSRTVVVGFLLANFTLTNLPALALLWFFPDVCHLLVFGGQHSCHRHSDQEHKGNRCRSPIDLAALCCITLSNVGMFQNSEHCCSIPSCRPRSEPFTPQTWYSMLDQMRARYFRVWTAFLSALLLANRFIRFCSELPLSASGADRPCPLWAGSGCLTSFARRSALDQKLKNPPPTERSIT